MGIVGFIRGVLPSRSRSQHISRPIPAKITAPRRHRFSGQCAKMSASVSTSLIGVPSSLNMGIPAESSFLRKTINGDPKDPPRRIRISAHMKHRAGVAINSAKMRRLLIMQKDGVLLPNIFVHERVALTIVNRAGSCSGRSATRKCRLRRSTL